MADGSRNPDQPMEATTPFDLNQAIQRWRENLGQSPAFRSENLFELESHLRDSVARLQRQELSDEEAFLVATKRLGPPATLETEFAKQNVQLVWLDRALWVLVGAQIWGIAQAVTHVLGLFLGIGIPSMNSWLAAHGFGQIPEDGAFPMMRLILFPLMLLTGARVAVRVHRWFQSKGKSPVTYIQQRPRVLALIFALLSALPPLVYYSGQILVWVFGPNRVYGSLRSTTEWKYSTEGLTVILFSILVWELARKRLRLSCKT